MISLFLLNSTHFSGGPLLHSESVSGPFLQVPSVSLSPQRESYIEQSQKSLH